MVIFILPIHKCYCSYSWNKEMKNNKTKQKALRYIEILATDFLVGTKCLARNTLGRKGYFGSRFEETESIIAGKVQRQVFPWP